MISPKKQQVKAAPKKVEEKGKEDKKAEKTEKAEEKQE